MAAVDSGGKPAGASPGALLHAARFVLPAAVVVLVHLVSPTPGDEHTERLIRACTQGLRRGACVLAGRNAGEQRSALAAEVRCEDETCRVVVIRLGRAGTGESEWTTGKLAFDEGDAPQDRWTTAGFAIATLVGDLAESEPVSATLPNSAAEPAGAPLAARDVAPLREGGPAPISREYGRATAGFALGQAMRGQALRAGPWASVAHAVFGLPVAARLRGAAMWATGAGASVSWATVAVGFEVLAPAGRYFAFIAAADAGPTFLTARGERSASRVVLAVSAFLGAEVQLAGPLWAIAGGEVQVSPATSLHVESSQIEDRRVKLGGVSGLSLDF